jgi:hypothetical protein
MTVGAKYGALSYLSFHTFDGKTAANHVGHVELLAVARVMVKLQRAVIGEPAAFTGKTFLIIVEPRTEPAPAAVDYLAPTLLTPPIAIYFAADDFADRECFVR